MSDELQGIIPPAIIMPALPANYTEQQLIEYMAVAIVQRLIAEYSFDDVTSERKQEIANEVARQLMIFMDERPMVSKQVTEVDGAHIYTARIQDGYETADRI